LGIFVKPIPAFAASFPLRYKAKPLYQGYKKTCPKYLDRFFVLKKSPFVTQTLGRLGQTKTQHKFHQSNEIPRSSDSRTCSNWRSNDKTRFKKKILITIRNQDFIFLLSSFIFLLNSYSFPSTKSCKYAKRGVKLPFSVIFALSKTPSASLL
jgi:hypothetical protein